MEQVTDSQVCIREALNQGRFRGGLVGVIMREAMLKHDNIDIRYDVLRSISRHGDDGRTDPYWLVLTGWQEWPADFAGVCS